MYASKLKIKTSSVNVWRSLCWWPDLSDCLITSSISQDRPQKKPGDHNSWDDGEARREDLGWQSEDVVWRRHWRQTILKRQLSVKSATPRHVYTVTACFSQSSEDPSLQTLFSLTILLCLRGDTRNYGHVNYLLTCLINCK